MNCAVCNAPTEGGKIVCGTECLAIWAERAEAASARSRQAHSDAMAMYGAYLRGELEPHPLEAKARVHVGADPGEPIPLTADEREYMARDAYHCDPSYPYAEGIALNDRDLSEWWLSAMSDYVQDMFG